MLDFFRKWYANIARHCDPLELEQASFRIPAVFVLYGLVLFSGFNHSFSHQEYLAFQIISIYGFIALLLLAAIIKNKFSPVLRKLFGAWIDIGGASLFMTVTADVGVMLVAFDLWAIFGNGFRYGTKYLYHAQLLSIIGFLIAFKINPYWQLHETISYTIIAMLGVLPLYVAKLISRLNDAIHKEGIERKKATEANLAKTQFVANMSHEIRTPLNGIIGINTLLKTTPLNEDQQDLLKTLDSSSRLLLSLLNNILDISKIEERKFTVENIEFSTHDAINDTFDIFHSLAEAKGVEFIINNPEKPGLYIGDPSILRQILANLVGNAVKFTYKGSIKISATLIQDHINHSTIRFAVADTGIGIPADKQANIFDSFTQADASTTRKFGGSGLGLTIAKHMVEAMGGMLNCYSVEGEGSRFWFDLNLEKAKTIHKPIVTSENNSDNVTIVPIQSASTRPQYLNILVCEDERTNQKIITRLLSLPGHHVQLVENSDEMLDALEVKRFDLVITDLNMAGMSGADALKLYRFTQPDDKHTRFILLTADASTSAKQLANEAGFNAFLPKPIDAETLYKTIAQTLELDPNTAKAWINTSLNSKPAESTASIFNQDTPLKNALSLDLNTLRDLESIGAGDELFMPRLLRNYLADSAKQIQKIELCARQHEFSALHDYCHAFKGNSLSVGAIKLASLIETTGKLNASNTPSSILEALNTLHREFNLLTEEIENYLRKPEVASNKN